MNWKRLIPLALAVALCALGASLIFYGSTLPPDFVVHGIWHYSKQSEVNVLMLIGIFPICAGVALLLLCVFTRSKPTTPHPVETEKFSHETC